MKKYFLVPAFSVSVVFLFILFLAGIANAQSIPAKALDYSKAPYWIAMMNDSNVNYFEAVKAFKTYWRNRPEPSEANEMKAHAEGKNEKHNTPLGKVLHAEEIRQEEEAEKYRLEYKKFLHWKMAEEPYVQSDGHILSKAERLEIWKKQRR